MSKYGSQTIAITEKQLTGWIRHAHHF